MDKGSVAGPVPRKDREAGAGSYTRQSSLDSNSAKQAGQIPLEVCRFA